MAGPASTDYAEIQDNELQALASIYMENFEAKESKPGAWNVRRALIARPSQRVNLIAVAQKSPDREFVLRLGPSNATTEETTEDAFVTLHVSLPTTYPRSPPRCRLDFAPMLPNSIRSKVNQILRDKPKDLIGSEMMYDLTSSIQEVLDDGMADILKAREVPALDKERAAREAQARRKAEEDREMKDRKQKAADEEEQRHLSELVQQERSRLAKMQVRSRRSSSASEVPTLHSTILSFDQEIKLKDTKTAAIVAFRSIISKNKYRKGPVTTVYTTDPLLSDDNAEDDPEIILALKECTLKAEKKSIQALEARLETLSKLAFHPNIMRLLAFRVTKAAPPSPGWTVNILMPFAEGRSLRDLLNTIGTIDVTNMRSWTIQMLEGLHFLHQNSIMMARMNIDNVLLEMSDTGRTVVKLSDASYQHEIHMIHSGAAKFSSAASSYWLAPETDKAQLKLMPSQDIWYFGVVLLQSLFGIGVQSQYNGPGNLINTVDLSASFEDLLVSVFYVDPKKRPSAFELLANAFLRSDDPVLEQTSATPNRELTPIPSHSTGKIPASRTGYSGAASVSRYGNDFVESGRLGRGGFGEVVRARNKLDGTTYAIKKIIQSSAAELSGVLSEVMLLSRLNHPNIVRYYTAWVEEEGQSGMLRRSDSSSSEGESSFSRYNRSTTQGLDFISSGRADDGIEFGYASDEEAEDEEDSGAIDDEEGQSSKPPKKMLPVSPQRRRRSSASFSAKVTLYIQMEYCEKQTLRDLLRDLHANVDECWRLFKQILSSLAYIHSNGVLHRDLKPDNIFIALDESDQPRIRIGDFGLARPGGSSRKTPSLDTASGNLTASIGTSLYVAPEVRSSGGGSYNEKADMYALGVILFEMSYPLKTSMERAQVLGDLRQPSFEYPELFEEPEKQLQAQIIRSLVKQKPGDRPSAHDLLHSGRIPSQVEDEAIQSALRSLSDKTSPFFSKLMDGLFSQMARDSGSKDLTYDLDLNLVSQTSDNLLLQSMLQEHLRSIFTRHGAVEVQRQYMLPALDIYETSVRFLDASGTAVQLPYDLTVPYARSIANQTNLVRKSYSFGHVFRAAPAGLHPRTHGEFDFDIVTDDSLDLALREAEVLKVADEVIDALPAFSLTPIVYHLTHSTLLDAILTFCGLPSQPSVKQIISRLNIGQFTPTRIRNELRSLDIGISSTSLDDLMRFNFREPYDVAIPKLRALLESSSDELESTFRHLEAVTTYMRRFNIKRKIFIYPLGSINERFYRGSILFQCILDGKRKKVLCAGGRYDSLIQEYRTGAKLNRRAVGFNFAWENLVDTMAQWLRPTGKQFLKRPEDDGSDSAWKPRRCDVLVDSNDPGLLRSIGISIVQDLWAADVKAELVIDAGIRESASFQQQGSRDESSGHDWLVLVKQDESLKVRSNLRKEDFELRRSELLGWLRSELRERERNDGRAATASSTKALAYSHAHEHPSADARDASVSVLVAQHRGKKSNRRMVVDDALSRTADAATAFRHAPIAAVELKDDVFEAMRETRFSDPESWRRFAQAAPLSDRLYLGQIHDMLRENATSGAAVAWVYNFRSKNCFLYDLGKVT